MMRATLVLCLCNLGLVTRTSRIRSKVDHAPLSVSLRSRACKRIPEPLVRGFPDRGKPGRRDRNSMDSHVTSNTPPRSQIGHEWTSGDLNPLPGKGGVGTDPANQRNPVPYFLPCSVQSRPSALPPHRIQVKRIIREPRAWRIAFSSHDAALPAETCISPIARFAALSHAPITDHVPR